MNPGSAPSPTVILAYAQNEYCDYLSQVLASGGYSQEPVLCNDLNTLISLVENYPDHTLLLTDLIWDGADCGELLLSLSLNHPNLAPLLISNYDLSTLVPPFFPLPSVQGFEDAAAILGQMAALAEDLRGQAVGSYQIQEFRGLSHLARRYGAFQPAIRREVHLNLQSPTADTNQRELFRQVGRAMAGNIHPNIYAIYEEGEHQGRYFLTQEPVNAPTLFQLGLQDYTFDARLLARVLHTACVTLQHLHRNGIPHLLISPTHITLSGEGVIKMVNTALPRGNPVPDPAEEMATLARTLRPFLPPQDANAASLVPLLDQMEGGQLDLEAALAQSQAVDLALAPEKFVPQRQEALKAQVEVQKAKKTSVYALYGFSAGLTCLTIFIIWKVLFGVVLEEPGIDYQGQFLIPAGNVPTSTPGKTIEVKAFYMDQYEVTIGQYEKFVIATEGKDIRSLLPPGWTGKKEDFEPDDWKGILTSIRKRSFYERVGERLTRNHPIFNIDYVDAYAYAKWAGKRLPTEAEWVRAAGGDENLRFPWGADVDRKFTNTGLDMNADKLKKIDPAGVDGFRGPAKVDQFAKDIKDTSPFGPVYMGGNVSEWVETTPDISSNTKPGMAYVRGGNFNTSALVPNQSRIPQDPETRQPYLGMRCVSDGPMGKVLDRP